MQPGKLNVLKKQDQIQTVFRAHVRTWPDVRVRQIQILLDWYQYWTDIPHFTYNKSRQNNKKVCAVSIIEDCLDDQNGHCKMTKSYCQNM